MAEIIKNQIPQEGSRQTPGNDFLPDFENVLRFLEETGAEFPVDNFDAFREWAAKTDSCAVYQ